MQTTLKISVATVALAAFAAVPVATGIMVLPADTAVAQSAHAGGQGKGSAGGRGGGRESAARGGPSKDRGPDAENPGRGAPEGRGAPDENEARGRGAMASALGALNAANANPTALENAAPNSMPGKLYTYRQTGGISVDEIVAYSDAQSSLTDVQAAVAADGDGVIQADEEGYLESLDVNGDGQVDDEDATLVRATVDDLQDAYTALSDLGDGSLTLTADQLAELNQILFVSDG